MMTNLQKEIQKVFKKFPEYWEGETLLKNKAIEDMREYEPNLLAALLENETIKETYSVEINDNYIFKNEEFISMLRYKNYLENNYTKYSNQIGLTSEDKYLNYSSDIVLDFPHKDGVLEGGMTKEDLGKEEIFYHNILAKDEIDTLFSPKTLNNIKKIDENGSRTTNKFNDNDNLIIKGNNLLALHSLKEKYEGKIKFIYIDPPYNTGNDGFKYNDNFNHSTWLTFMKNRLEIARELLTEDGVLFVSIDGNEFDYLSVLLREIYGTENLLEVFHFQVRYANKSLNERDDFQPVIEYGFAYAKNKKMVKPNKPSVPYDTSKFIFDIKELSKPDRTFNLDDGRKVEVFHEGSYKIEKRKNLTELEQLEHFKETWITGSIYSSTGHGTMYQRAVEPFREIDGDKSLYKIDGLGQDGLGYRYMTNPRQKTAQYGKMFTKIPLDTKEKVLNNEAERYLPIVNFYDFSARVGNIRHEGGVVFNNGKKPEAMISLLVDFFTKERDIVLDYHLGSGTTAAVAHKMKRRYIGIEQMDYGENNPMVRLKNVINGDTTGISNDVGWQGGGSFVYAELYELNQVYINEIQNATNQETIEKVLEKIRKSDFLNLKVDLEKVFSENDEFFDLKLSEQKAILIQVLDNNQLYLSYSEIDDDQYAIDEDTKAFNASFYDEEV